MEHSAPTVRVIPDPPPPSAAVGRLVLVGEAAGEAAAPEPLLFAALRTLAEAGTRVEYLHTPAGFVNVQRDDEWMVGDLGWGTSPADFGRLRDQAEAEVREVLSERVLRIASRAAANLSLGVDLAYRRPHARALVGQFVVLVHSSDGAVLAALGKSYPTVGEVNAMVRDPNPRDHVVTLGSNPAAGLLVCHDLSAFNPRAISNRRGARADAGERLIEAFKRGRPAVLLHHAHVTAKPGTWRLAWGSLRRRHPELAAWSTAFRWADLQDGNRPAQPRIGTMDERLLRQTAGGDVVTVVVGGPLGAR